MKLWILTPKVKWDPWYDKAFGFVIRAKTEVKARELASENAGDEGKEVWMNVGITTCIPLNQTGPEEKVILIDFHAA